MLAALCICCTALKLLFNSVSVASSTRPSQPSALSLTALANWPARCEGCNGHSLGDVTPRGRGCIIAPFHPPPTGYAYRVLTSVYAFVDILVGGKAKGYIRVRREGEAVVRMRLRAYIELREKNNTVLSCDTMYIINVLCIVSWWNVYSKRIVDSRR